MTKKNIKFILNGKEVIASNDETLWQISKREGTTIPHLCHSDEVGYRSDGNCRACMVEIDGERTLAASCIRMPTEGMKVNTESKKSITARKTVFELLSADEIWVTNSIKGIIPVTDYRKKSLSNTIAAEFINFLNKKIFEN